MDNPILQNYRSKALYLGIVILFIIIQSYVVFLAKNISFGFALVDSFVSNTIFAGCVILLWYPVCYIPWKSRVLYINVLTYISMFGLLLLVWFGVFIDGFVVWRE